MTETIKLVTALATLAALLMRGHPMIADDNRANEDEGLESVKGLRNQFTVTVKRLPERLALAAGGRWEIQAVTHCSH